MSHVLYDLAAFPEYIEPLREEVETITAVDGWTKAAMGKMRKLDSFLKESQRFNGIGLSASPSLPPPFSPPFSSFRHSIHKLTTRRNGMMT